MGEWENLEKKRCGFYGLKIQSHDVIYSLYYDDDVDDDD